MKIPPGYKVLLPRKKAEICNGCGPGGWKYDLVPDQILGLDISEACQIHDYLYHIGENEADRRYADDVFKTNMWILCDEAGGWKTWFRKVLCWYYWLGVRKFGQDAFWRDKWLD